ncbi:hypothetical protein [Janthinobacterium sp. LB2P10]|uniref:hypothetical protein n=1 Tax=Janthinobacterium sp. LB2P10 TaxID=3424194 RepID=UPI003F212D77
MNIAQKIATAGFDISLLSGDAAPVEKTHRVSVLFDDEGNHRAGFDMVGKNSEQYRAVIRETSVVAIKRSQQKKQQIDAKTDDGAGTLFDLGEDRNFKIACAVIVGAPGFMDKGEPVAVTTEFLRAAFTKFPTWQDRILAELEADANFLAI